MNHHYLHDSHQGPKKYPHSPRYLHPQRRAEVGDTIEGQSHAWVQAWTGGWWDYDPTNDVEINEQYVTVAVGRDYSDVTPLKGIYSGEGSTDLDVVVEITRLA